MSTAKAIEQAHNVIQLAGAALRTADVDLTADQYMVLSIVAESDGRAAMADMARRLTLAPTVITGYVDRLEAKGLVRRESDPKDRRRNWIRLTANGHRVLLEAATALGRAA